MTVTPTIELNHIQILGIFVLGLIIGIMPSIFYYIILKFKKDKRNRMNKLLEITNCRQCPYSERSGIIGGDYGYCKNPGLDYKDFEFDCGMSIPEWCPLPNAEE